MFHDKNCRYAINAPTSCCIVFTLFVLWERMLPFGIFHYCRSLSSNKTTSNMNGHILPVWIFNLAMNVEKKNRIKNLWAWLVVDKHIHLRYRNSITSKRCFEFVFFFQRALDQGNRISPHFQMISNGSLSCASPNSTTFWQRRKEVAVVIEKEMSKFINISVDHSFEKWQSVCVW